ncbi:trigger factor [Chamaesiphon minutus]|uniref:Trigger factor n=1 Tax=Chamaesiphon minutus (strain ATCC 27169 / PCC 6605) TaxID=1173020 RepID=K9UL75_CHAP6|nr:trigger factor [Chamaesiphon minutus]AFY95403.1 trigger factor [Chamaesiphon minutus PCC 6605]
MKVTQEKLEHSRIGLQIEVTGDQTTKYYEQAIKKLTTSANIPGFRKGKIPRQVILQRMGQTQVKAMALEALLEPSINQAIEQESVPAIGNYQITSDFDKLLETYVPGQALTFGATVDVPPTVTLGTYTGLAVKAEEIVYDPAQVDDFIDRQRREKATTVPVVGRAAKLEDIAVVDYEGKLADGTLIDGAQADDFDIELSEGKFISDLVHGIVGMNVGETREVNVTFPADYPREDLAAQPAIFNVVLKDLKEQELPALDDDFAKEASDFDTLAEYRESIVTRFQEQAKKSTDQNITTAIETALIDVAEADLPETAIERETMNILNQMANQFSQYGMDVNKLFTRETIPKMKENCRPDAISNIKQQLAIAEIAKRENITVGDEDIAAKMSEIIPQLAGENIDENRLRSFITEDLQKEKTLEWLKEHAKVELVPEGSLKATVEDDEATSAGESEAIDILAEAVAE